MNIWYIAVPLLMLLIAYANSKYYQKQGYKFWLTFLFSLLMLIGLTGMFLKALGLI